MKHAFLAVATVGFVALSMLDASAQTASKLPSAGQMISSRNAYDLYAGKTWVWADGAAYFAPNQRFTAWTGAGNKLSFAEGNWRVTPLGTLCFSAWWHEAVGANHNVTCFGHRMVDGALYQQKQPGGPWYVFRSAAPSTTDEFAKLKKGDDVSATYDRIRAQLRKGKVAAGGG